MCVIRLTVPNPSNLRTPPPGAAPALQSSYHTRFLLLPPQSRFVFRFIGSAVSASSMQKPSHPGMQALCNSLPVSPLPATASHFRQWGPSGSEDMPCPSRLAGDLHLLILLIVLFGLIVDPGCRECVLQLQFDAGYFNSLSRSTFCC